MSTNVNPHNDATKYGIDLRLDAIDRALLGLLPRHERMELVGQIETKLREVAEANPPLGAEPSEARPDYSERFDEVVETAARGPAVRSSATAGRALLRRRPRSRLAVSSGIMGIVALSLLAALPFVYLLASISGDEWITFSLIGGNVAAVALGGLLAVAMGIAALVALGRSGGRLIGHGWAITGLCTGPLPMFVGGLVALVLGAQLYGTVSVTPAYSVSAVPPAGPVTYSGSTSYPPPQVVPAPTYSSSPEPTPAGALQPPTSFDPNAAGYAPGTPAPAPPNMEAAPSLSGAPHADLGADPLLTTQAEVAPPAAQTPTVEPSPPPSTIGPLNVR